MARLPRGARGLAWRLHRWLGLASLLFVLLVVVTGLLLNHAAALGLDRAHLRSETLLRHYGLAPKAQRAARVGEAWLLWLDGRLALGTRAVTDDMPPLVGAVGLEEAVAAAGADALLLMTPEGTLIERLGSEALPGPLLRIGRGSGGELVVDTARGAFAGDAELLGWRPDDGDDVQWSRLEPPPRELARAQWPFEALSVERLLLDLHSGRLFGLTGTLLADLIGVALLLLLATGLHNWWTKRRT